VAGTTGAADDGAPARRDLTRAVAAAREMRRVGAVLAAVAMVSCGGAGARSQSRPAVRPTVVHQPVPLPADTTAPTEPFTAPPTTAPPVAGAPTTLPPAVEPPPATTSSAPDAARADAPTEPETPASVAPPLPPDTTAAPGPPMAASSPSACPLRLLPPAAPPEDVATVFVIVYGTVAAAEDQAIRLNCLRSRLSDPLGSPTLRPPSFTPDQLATRWRLDPTDPPALAVDQDSPQSSNHVVLTATLRAQVSHDGAKPVPTVSQLLLELINSSGRWLVASMSNRTVPS
jgi:hypothetical protein